VSDGSRVAMAANLIEGLNALMTGRVEGALVQELSRS